jgi:hypothetical protein
MISIISDFDSVYQIKRRQRQSINGHRIYHYMSLISSLRGKIGIRFSYLDLSVNLSISKNPCFVTEFYKIKD